MVSKNLSQFVFGIAAFGCIFLAGTSVGKAFDIKEEPLSSKNPFEVFFSAYKSGHKDEAVKALRFAADQGHLGANWKLARMYADGDGLPEDDYAAYQIFEKIVRDGVDEDSESESFVSDALVSLAGYVRDGIPNSPIKADMRIARELYAQAASSFGDPAAQFELGRMYLTGEGGEKNTVQAARWFQLAAQKGNTSAQAMLGSMLFEAGKTVRGLAMMTAAFERCPDDDREWIRELQEQAFSITTEQERRSAVQMASSIFDQ